MAKFKTESSKPLLEALEHPIRARVLAALGDRSASAADIAAAIEVPVAKVRYHLRALAALGLIVRDEAEERRGVREYYWVVNTPQIVEDEEHMNLTPEQSRQIGFYILRLMFADATAALRWGSFAERKDHVLTRFRPAVDEQGWTELVEIYRKAMAEIVQTSERAADRLHRAGAEPLYVNASLLLFEVQIANRPPPSLLPGPFE